MTLAGFCSSCGCERALGEQCPECGFDPNVGRIIGSKFEVRELVGGGGMCTVYRGIHLALGEPVAIKFLRRQFALDPIIRKRFRREAVALARLRHPGIVSILDFGETDNELYAVMELLTGPTLQEIASAGKMPVLRAGAVFDQLLATLEVCHAAGVVHRDLKPANVMIASQDGAELVKLIDFGIAQTLRPGDEKLTNTGTVQGTPQYMAPEQCRGDDVGAPADIYALGVMMYELFTGRNPYDADNVATMMAQHLFVEPPPMRTIEPSIPPGIDALVRRAMSKSESDRPTAKELRHELAAALKGTDPHSIAEASTAEKKRSTGLAREDRALTLRPHVDAIDVHAPASMTPIVYMWAPHDPHSTEVLSALGMSGISCVQCAKGDEIPSIPPDTGVAFLLSVRHGALERLPELRSRHPNVPVVVMDVAGPDQTAAVIRAGASDFALDGSSSAELGPKISRLLRRRQRRHS
ncbi:MAG: serine/threonine-protein kinase [Polyangiaceae bacterium]|nr:serine/threonine-protein kinase [Polyangiaceae bacterium]